MVESKDQSYIKEKALYCISSITSYLASEDPPLFIHVGISYLIHLTTISEMITHLPTHIQKS